MQSYAGLHGKIRIDIVTDVEEHKDALITLLAERELEDSTVVALFIEYTLKATVNALSNASYMLADLNVTINEVIDDNSTVLKDIDTWNDEPIWRFVGAATPYSDVHDKLMEIVDRDEMSLDAYHFIAYRYPAIASKFIAAMLVRMVRAVTTYNAIRPGVNFTVENTVCRLDKDYLEIVKQDIELCPPRHGC